jgi:hypothetical protein
LCEGVLILALLIFYTFESPRSGEYWADAGAWASHGERDLRSPLTLVQMADLPQMQPALAAAKI